MTHQPVPTPILRPVPTQNMGTRLREGVGTRLRPRPRRGMRIPPCYELYAHTKGQGKGRRRFGRGYRMDGPLSGA